LAKRRIWVFGELPFGKTPFGKSTGYLLDTFAGFELTTHVLSSEDDTTRPRR
jgi:hypothetical protein